MREALDALYGVHNAWLDRFFSFESLLDMTVVDEAEVGYHSRVCFAAYALLEPASLPGTMHTWGFA